MPRTVWLASYPKSGNTWLRLFLANLLFPEQAPVAINRLPLTTPNASGRMYFDEALGVSSALLSAAEAARLRPDAAERLNRVWDSDPLFRKVHDAYTWLGDGRPLLGRSPDFSAIYILRDPWDVAVSFAHFAGCPLDEAVGRLLDPTYTFSESRTGLRLQFSQRLLSWEGHVRSWLDAPLRLHAMRYERMRREPLAAFREAVRFLGFDHDDAAIDAALEACRFDRLKAQERESRFREAPRTCESFFRGGEVGDGLSSLSAGQRAALEAMKRRVDAAVAAREERR